MPSRSRNHIFFPVFVMWAATALVSGNALAQQIKMPTLGEIASIDPSREVELAVDLHQIFRISAVDELMREFNLKITEVQFKNIGSGGGGFGIRPDMTNSEGLRWAEENHNSRLLAAAGVTQENLPPCDISDENAAVIDTYGIPASKLREAACGLRIHRFKLKGPASVAFDFLNFVEPSVAVVRLVPSPYDMMRLMWHTRPDLQSPEFLKQIQQMFPEFDPSDFRE